MNLKIGVGILVMAVGIASGCARGTGIPEDAAASSNDRQRLPFDPDAQSSAQQSRGSATAAANKLPAGTPITIRLENTISSASACSGDKFHAVLDEPIVIDGRIVVARGAELSGQVLSAKASGSVQDPGYLRIALTSVKVGESQSALATSSIFVKGGPHEKRNLAMIDGGTLPDPVATNAKQTLIGTSASAAGNRGTPYGTSKNVSLGPDRRLTFRLAEPADLR